MLHTWFNIACNFYFFLKLNFQPIGLFTRCDNKSVNLSICVSKAWLRNLWRKDVASFSCLVWTPNDWCVYDCECSLTVKRSFEFLLLNILKTSFMSFTRERENLNVSLYRIEYNYMTWNTDCSKGNLYCNKSCE